MRAFLLAAVLVVIFSTRANADATPCYFAGYYLDLASIGLHDAKAYADDGKTDLAKMERESIDHNFNVAAQYAVQCPFEEPVALYDIRRGNMMLDAAKSGLKDDVAAASDAVYDLNNAVCNHADTYSPREYAMLKSRVGKAMKRQRTPWSPMTHKDCGG